MKLGVLVNLNQSSDITEKIKKVHDMGFSYCQISCWDMEAYTDEMAEKILAALEKYNVKISNFNFYHFSPPKKLKIKLILFSILLVKSLFLCYFTR